MTLADPADATVFRAFRRVATAHPDRPFLSILPEVAGVYPKIMMEGAMDEGAWSCGMVAGLIHDIPTCKELIDRIMLQAEEIIARMQAMARA